MPGAGFIRRGKAPKTGGGASFDDDILSARSASTERDLSTLVDAGLAQRCVPHNPLTYEVDALRALMLAGGVSDYGLVLSFGVMAGATALLVAIAAKMYGRMGY